MRGRRCSLSTGGGSLCACSSSSRRRWDSIGFKAAAPSNELRDGGVEVAAAHIVCEMDDVQLGRGKQRGEALENTGHAALLWHVDNSDSRDIDRCIHIPYELHPSFW